MPEPFYITTPIYYINAQPHIGHAYTTMVADAIARSRRLLGDDVFFLTGTDEHGQKVERAAQKAGMPTQAFADQVSQAFRQMCLDLNISNDDFIRTTEPRHHQAAQDIWRRVAANGDIYKGDYEGWYCTVDEIFVPETQLVDGKCPTCGNKVERLKEESYYFRLSKYQQPLLDFYTEHPEFLQPGFRLNEVRTFVEAGLQDLSISRTSFQWGIPVPDDPKHVMYVWFDALTNYLTALGLGTTDTSRVDRYWPHVTHLIGKEILRQHALYWPAFLMSAQLPLPSRIIAHGWWLMGGAKMSKSLGNVARYQDYVAIFGLDAVRYFVMREMTLGLDADFADERVLNRYNSDLANDLGNAVSRTATMIVRYCDGVVPEPTKTLPEFERNALGSTEALIERALGGFKEGDTSVALKDVWELLSVLNAYIAGREPWKLAKDPNGRPQLNTALYVAADMVRVVAALIDPVMPDAAARIRRMLGIQQESWSGLGVGGLKAGTRLGEIEPLFPRIEKTIEELRGMTTDITNPEPEPVAPSAPVAPAAPAASDDGRISIDDFMKVELRTAKIVEAEAVPKSKKLVKLLVDVGTERRTVLAGIAEAYQPEDLVGKTITIVANLKPAKLMGIESNGMVLAASPEGGKPTLITWPEGIEPGWRVR